MARRDRTSRTAPDRLAGDDVTAPFPVEVADRGDEFLVAAELPGLRKQDIDVSVWKNRLRIAADYDRDETTGTYLVRERNRDRGELRRVVTLPEPVDQRRVSASYDNGVLWVTLEKRERPKRVEVRG